MDPTQFDPMREIEEASDFSKVLKQCLDEKEEQLTIYSDWVVEQMLRADKAKRIIVSIPMPPPIQALQYQKTLLCDELDGVFVGLGAERRINTICIRIALIRKLQGDWLEEEINQMPKLVEQLHTIDFGFDVGANWQMHVFENLPTKRLLLEHKQKPKGTE